MDEIEHIEARRWRLFALVAVVDLIAFFAVSTSFFASLVLAIGTGALASGVWAAHASTRPVAWAYIESEARTSGYGPSRLGIWLGSVLPGLAVLAVGVWLAFR